MNRERCLNGPNGYDRELRFDPLAVLSSTADSHGHAARLTLVQASLSHWQPRPRFDLITCVHGLHYIGDKLELIGRARQWLTDGGTFVAHLDVHSLKLRNAKSSRRIMAALRDSGCEYDARHHLITAGYQSDTRLPFDYLGADDAAGPNYTGQPAVDSHYAVATPCSH